MVARLLLLAIALGVAVPAWAVDVVLRVPTRTLEVGQHVQVEVVLLNARASGVPQLQLDDGLTGRFAGQSQFTTVVGLNRVRTVSYAFDVAGTREGTFTLGPALVQVGGVTVSTDSETLEVRPRSAVVPQDPIVAYAELSVDTAWEGQVVLYTYGLRSRLRILRSQWHYLPVTELVRPRDGTPARKEYIIDDPDGPMRVDETLEPFIVTAREDLELPPAGVQVDVAVADPRSLFPAARKEVFATNGVDLRVRPLPPAPPGFSGLVGDFTFVSHQEATEVSVGQSVDWTVEVRGDGSLEGFSLPMPADLQAARVYDASPTMSARIEEQAYLAVGRFNRVIVPTEVGPLTVQPLEIVTFSPSRGAYVTHRIALDPMQVSPGREKSGEVVSFAPSAEPRVDQPAPEVVDIHPIYRNGRAHSQFTGPWLLAGALLLLLAGSIPIALDGVAWWRSRPRPGVEPHVQTPSQRLARLPERSEDRLTVLDDALREAVANRIDVPPFAVDRDLVLQALPAGLGEQVVSVGVALQRARFAGEAPGPDLAERVIDVVRQLEAA